MRHERVRKFLAGVLSIAIVVSLASAAVGLGFGLEASAITPPQDVQATETVTPPEATFEASGVDSSTVSETAPADDASAEDGAQIDSATVEATATETSTVTESEATELPDQEASESFSVAAENDPFVTMNGFVIKPGSVEKHDGCVFVIEFFSFPRENITADVIFRVLQPTGNDVIANEDDIPIGEDAAGGAADLDATRTYDITSRLVGVYPQDQNGYRIEIEILAPFGPGDDKRSDEFWVTGCDPSTATATATATETATVTATATVTRTATATATATQTATATRTATVTATATRTATSTVTATATAIATATVTATVGATATAGATEPPPFSANPPGPEGSTVETFEDAEDIFQDGADGADGTPAPGGSRQSSILNPGGSINSDGFRAGQLVAMLEEGADPNEVASRWHLQVLDQVPALNLVLFGSSEIADTRELIEPMSTDPDVAIIEVNAIAQAPEAHARSNILFSIPEDVSSNPQYGYELVGVTGASCVSGSGVVVAVLDTGIDPDHPEFRNRISDRGWNVLTGNADFEETQDGIDDDGDGLTDEMYGHGTHVSGIIVRVAPGAMIMPVKVLNDDGVGDAFGVAQGILYAVENEAQVINLSLSSTYDSEIVRASIDAVRDEGALVVAATGNSSQAEPKEYPAAADGVIGVAATGPDDVKSSFSNYGVEISMSAPGTDIESTLPDGNYGVASGTSMAAPFISGAVALTIEFYPDATPDEIELIIETSSVEIDPLNPEYAGQLGAGRLDLSNTIDCDG